jgi:pimeloyl-ACP methyl ester carboxylesterase
MVAWDAPGAGRSADPPENFRLPEYADCLAEFLAAVELQRPQVAGISFGGALALELYRRHPSVPRTLILAGAYAGWAGSLPAEEVQQRLQRLVGEISLPPERWIPAYLPGLLTESAPPDLVDETVALMSDVHPAGNLAMLRRMAEADLRDVLPRIDVPALVLHGDLDRRSDLSVGRELHAGIPGSQLVVLTGVGHLSNVEAADRFNREVRTFLHTQSS